MLKAVFGYQIRMTVNVAVKMVCGENGSRRDNGLQVPSMIEWE
jgi:hypothetical protein